MKRNAYMKHDLVDYTGECDNHPIGFELIESTYITPNNFKVNEFRGSSANNTIIATLEDKRIDKFTAKKEPTYYLLNVGSYFLNKSDQNMPIQTYIKKIGKKITNIKQTKRITIFEESYDPNSKKIDEFWQAYRNRT